jgi:hypothetical protein
VTSGTSYSPVTDHHEPHPRRRRSLDSRASTTMSQVDTLGPPTSGRDQRALGSITERSSVMASRTTPLVLGYVFSGVALVLQSPNFYQTNTVASHTPGLRVPSIDVDPAPSLHKSPSMSSDEYNFDIIHRCAFLLPFFFAWFCGLRVFPIERHVPTFEHFL